MTPTSWNEIKSLVKKLNPEFYQVIEEVGPHPNLKLHLVDYKYGEQIADEHHFYIPDGKGDILSIPKPVAQPMLLLEGTIEVYYQGENNIMPRDVYRTGKIFPVLLYTEHFMHTRFSLNLNSRLSAGSRSAYMLQLHSFNECYAKLQKEYQIPKAFKPTQPLDHYKIFKEIAQKEHAPWKVRVLLFDQKWLEAIWQNPAWSEVRLFFFKSALKLTNPWHWSVTYHQTLRDISHAYRFKLKAYSEDFIRQILTSATDVLLPVFIPAHTEKALPLDVLARAFNASYGTHNLPVIMHADQSDMTTGMNYLSISHNTLTTYDIKTYRPLLYLNEIKEYLPHYLEKTKSHPVTQDTLYAQMQDHLKLQFYSEKGVESEGILRASELQYDPRIIKAYESYRFKVGQTFPERAPFLKAFVGFTFDPKF